MTSTSSLFGLYVDAAGRVHLAEGRERTVATADLRPFLWHRGEPDSSFLPDQVRLETLAGEAPLNWLLQFGDISDFQAFLKESPRGKIDLVTSLESQYLLQNNRRLFENTSYRDLRLCVMDIETRAAGEPHFPDPALPDDRILAIGARQGDEEQILLLEEDTDAAERELLLAWNRLLEEWDPDVIAGHNLFRFDLNYLKVRSKRLRVPCAWGRFGQAAIFRNSRLRVAERMIDFPRCDLPGRAVVDTYHLVQLHDITTRDMPGYGLKEAALHLGITDGDEDDRTYLEGPDIQESFLHDPDRFRQYLQDDLRETLGLADLFLPTYFEQAKVFPMTLQDAVLRGTAMKVDLLFLDRYYHARGSCPVPGEPAPFAGGFTESFREGVFYRVLHFDVASLYPSLLLSIARNPAPDHLGMFLPLLQELRRYRLEYKKLSREDPDPLLRAEYQARQTAFKILINSFYGYLGFGGARFGDSALAGEVTARGRDLLQQLIHDLEKRDLRVLEADTDGLYVEAGPYYDTPDALLEILQASMPAGIDLEFDGAYPAMFCYKAKNYALFDGEKVTIRGSALRSRGTEPFLRKLTNSLIWYLLGAADERPDARAEELRTAINSGQCDVALLAKSEVLSQNPETYAKAMAGGGKPRRAALEAALKMTTVPRMGDRVRYFILPRQKGQSSDWQRAEPIEKYDPVWAPYDPGYYLKKLAEWEKRYLPYLERKPG